MRKPSIGSLEGITLLHSPDTFTMDSVREFEDGSLTKQRITAFVDAEQHTADLARKQGATILCADESDVVPGGSHVYWQSRTYAAAHQATQRLLAAHSGHISDMPRVRFSDLLADSVRYETVRSRLDSGNPYVLAYTPLDNGHIKYYLDKPSQLERFTGFITQATTVDPNNFELRPFVSTPSDRYTSFRIVVDACGTMLAAGIHYSMHTKAGPPRKIVADRFSDSRPTSVVRLIKTALEDPASKHYIDASDVRSNSSCGGRIIALMGENRKPYDSQEIAILEAHEIDPSSPRPPEKLAATAQFIGRTVGPQTHLLSGVDFVADLHSETNFAPGGGVFAACHMRGKGTITERYIAMRESALVNLAISNDA